ncbi:phosphate signaling complex protein PhoU [Elstera cyanobacteriorum]|uniref:phosphate signaling complex protein PhoU n=1 Tax=Elstera cyanobacteriorum TaxID=2022747 RepID=UPI002356A0E0|nr:phosphate signaling complex protein PhoU [Elstera cyanobacteriorum]MCK6443258.1 phosphate signaling complex protein PhoU [Elstera cyanobacteriorum]
MSNEHIVSSFDEELRGLHKSIMQMGGLVEAQIAQSLQAMNKRDSQLASAVVANDGQVDALHHEIDEQVVRMLALRQPMASDLRTVVASLRIATDLERIGDYAANIAKRTLALNVSPTVKPAAGVLRMGKIVQSIVNDVLDAYADRNADRAAAIRERDTEVDELYTSLFRELLTYMMEDPRNITACTHVLFMSKNLERMGDHATNIAETIYYIVRGKVPAEERAKGDLSSVTAMTEKGETFVAADSKGN